MRAFGEELSGSLAREIEQSVGRAMHPVAQSMDRFLEGTTRQQIDGMRHLVNQVVVTMDQVLQGQLHGLSETLEQTVRQQQTLQDELRQASQMIGAQAGDAETMRQVARQVLGHFDSYVAAITEQNQQMEGERTGAAELLTRLHNAASEQADYLAQLREHQEALEKYLQDYYLWIRGFAENLGTQTQAQREALTAVASEMREGADLLQGSYNSFVDNIQEGLSSALGLFDESVQRQTGRITLMLDAVSHGMPLPRPNAAAIASAGLAEDGVGEDIRTLTNAIQGLTVMLQHSEVRKEVS
jgi:chromosome segregation ATPase